MCAQGASFPHLLRETPASRAGLPAARSQPSASPILRPAAAVPAGACKQPPLGPHRLRPRRSPPRWRLEMLLSGPTRMSGQRTAALHRAPSLGLQRESRRDAEEGLILRRKAAAATALPAAPRGRYITAARSRAGRRSPLWCGKRCGGEGGKLCRQSQRGTGVASRTSASAPASSLASSLTESQSISPHAKKVGEGNRNARSLAQHRSPQHRSRSRPPRRRWLLTAGSPGAAGPASPT